MSDINIVQIGANVGKSQTDASWILVEKFGWTGLFVEPIPKSFDKLKDYYTNFDKNHLFENCAIIGDKHKTKVTINYSEKEKLSVMASVGNASGRPENNLSLLVPAMTLESLLEKHNMLNKEFELLQMDVEGLESSIVNNTDFNKVIPKRIRLETIHNRNNSSMLEFLKSFGYKVVDDFYWEIYSDHLTHNYAELKWNVEHKCFNTLLERS